MVSLNKVMLIGNVGSDPEMRFIPNGNPVTSFRVATNRFYTTPDGERKQETDWFSIVTWNKLAEQCNQFLTKGRLVYVKGGSIAERGKLRMAKNVQKQKSLLTVSLFLIGSHQAAVKTRVMISMVMSLPRTIFHSVKTSF